MDLLSGYGSSSDDEGEQEEATANRNPLKSPSATAIVAPSLTKSTSTSVVNSKGKKILSLTAVLPPHILGRLTKAQALDSQLAYADENASDDDDSTDDDDDNQDHTTIPSSSYSKPSVKSKDESLSLLLSDLKAVAPSNKPADRNSLLLQTKLTASSSSLKPNNPISSSSSSKSQTRLGQSFVTSTTTRIASKRAVLDIHQDKTQNDHTIHRDPSPPPPLSSLPQPPAQPSDPHNNAHPSVHLPFSSSRLVSAAPPVTHSTHKADSSNMSVANYGGSSWNNDSLKISNDDFASSSSRPSPQQQHSTQSRKKRSRKELERALRHGNLAAIRDHSSSIFDVQSLQQANPDDYTPAPETYAVPVHGIKVAPTAMYDASAGTTVVSGNVASGRGKNQIHHVMAAAAQLELQRARQPSSSAGQAHRANAKAKYGW